MEALIAAFLEHHVAHLSVAAEVRGTIRLYFVSLRTYRISDLTPLIIESWFHEIGKHSKSQANKSLGILRTMLEKAKDWRLYDGENAARRVKPYSIHARTRFVQPKEMPLLMHSLKREDEMTQCYFLLCLLVGCRRTEGLTMRWVDLDTDACVWNKRRTKTGIPHTVPIPAALMARIAALAHRNEYVFSTKRSTHWSPSSAYGKWCAIRKGASLPDVTIHDLRRTCASWLCIHGENLAVIGRGVLNHTSLSHTGIYARLNVTPVQRALEDNSLRMMGLEQNAPPMTPHVPPQTPPPAPLPPQRPIPPWTPTRTPEREEWPG